MGKIKYYAIRVKFQVCGSSHVHYFLWVANAPVLTQKNKEGCLTFVDQIVNGFVPDRNENPELHDLVKLYQLHRHSRTCKNEPCRFKFEKLFSKRKKKIVVEPLPENIPEKVKVLVLRKRNEIFVKSETTKQFSKSIKNKFL